MNISGVLITTAPESIPSISQSINAFSWAQTHHSDASGRMIVTIEAETTGEEIERLKTLKQLEGVLFAEMVVHCFEDEVEPDPQDIAITQQILNEDQTLSGKSFYQRLKALGNF